MSDFDNKNPIATDENGEAKNSLPSKTTKNSLAKELIIQAELIIIAFSVIILMFSFVVRTCRVMGPSMENTLYDQELVLTSNLFYQPSKGDIVVFHQTGYRLNEPVVKRIIGLPGDTVKIEYFDDFMRVTVTDENGNSNILEEEYAKYVDTPIYNNSITYVEDGTLFVMGDNRNHSADSRDSYIGLVDQRRILGKVILRVFPISRFGIVD